MTLGLPRQFKLEGGVAVGNNHVTIALYKGKPRPKTLGHISFDLPNMTALRKALSHLQKLKVEIEDPGDEIGPKPRVRRTRTSGFTISMDTAGN